MRGGDDDTIAVDLVEVDSPDALLPVGEVAGEPVGGPPVRGPEATRRRRRRTQIGVSAGVVLALAGTGLALSALDERRAQARWDALAAQGLPLVQLTSPVEEVWRLPYGGYPMTASGGVLVVQAWEPTSMTSPWRALDVTTGQLVWERTDIGSGWCTQWNPTWAEEQSVYVGSVQSFLGGAGAGPASATLLVCADGGFGGQVPAPGTTTTLHVVEITTGREVGAVVVDGAVLSFTPVADDLVVASVAADGTVHLARTALVGGTARWEVATGVPAVDGDGMVVTPWQQTADGLTYLVSPEGALLEVRSVDTGEPVPGERDLPAVTGGRLTLPDGSVAEVLYPGMSALGGGSDGAEVPVDVDVPTVRVTGPDGRERFSVEGELWTPYFSDGSMADRIVVSRWGQGASSLAALDVETGAELWSSRAPWSSPVLQTDGVVVAGSGYLSVIDLRTGAEIWERQATGDLGFAPVTDGSRILVPVAERGVTSLVALDVRTGEEVWRTPTVEGVQLFLPMAGGVLVGTESALVLYR